MRRVTVSRFSTAPIQFRLRYPLHSINDFPSSCWITNASSLAAPFISFLYRTLGENRQTDRWKERRRMYILMIISRMANANYSASIEYSYSNKTLRKQKSMKKKNCSQHKVSIASSCTIGNRNFPFPTSEFPVRFNFWNNLNRGFSSCVYISKDFRVLVVITWKRKSLTLRWPGKRLRLASASRKSRNEISSTFSFSFLLFSPSLLFRILLRRERVAA